MNRVAIYLSLLYLMFLLMVTNCAENNESTVTETCENFQTLHSMIHVVKAVTVALEDILAAATFQAEDIEDEVCVIHKNRSGSLPDTDYCLKAERDCSALYRLGFRKNGVYRIWPEFLNRSIRVYCDMEADGGGWTIIQRRGEFGEPHITFFRDWPEYKTGFGDVEKEFWLGNDAIFALTNQAPTLLRINLEGYDGQKRYATYQKFIVRSEIEDYRMTVENYSGTAGDGMKIHSDKIFLTQEQGSDCATMFKSGWWYSGGWSYSDCFKANLNGKYLHEANHTKFRYGIHWTYFGGRNNSLKATEMKVRPCNC